MKVAGMRNSGNITLQISIVSTGVDLLNNDEYEPNTERKELWLELVLLERIALT